IEQAGPVEQAIAATTAALSGLSACAGMVMVAKRDLVLRQMSFVTLSADKALAVLVGDDGSVENRVIDIPLGLPPSALIEAGNYMSAMLG
ncbi:heat-inducible transcriptional repressor HrcA, partial [Pseudomonas sp. GW247-3R2A]